MSDDQGTEGQEDAILQIIGHHRGFTELRQPWRRNYQDVNAWNAIRTERLPTFAKYTTGTPVTGLGILQGLPLDVILNILAEMDIKTALRFRQANRRAYDLVHDQASFRAVARHAHQCLMTVIDKGLVWRSFVLVRHHFTAGDGS
ncbi:hypothetical protein GE09DRAFT_363239 [Coniochaeta sp. 2T2.1]|nr:hypothetical protein GE09DRAFT_363239 [Coniochaeta sp. 2T2.1]